MEQARRLVLFIDDGKPDFEMGEIFFIGTATVLLSYGWIHTTPHVADKLKNKGFKATRSLNTWETLTVTKGDSLLCISAMPGRHGPGVLNALLPPVMGNMLEFGNSTGETGFRLYITGDRLIYDQLKEIPHRYPNIDLALLHRRGAKIFGIVLIMDSQTRGASNSNYCTKHGNTDSLQRLHCFQVTA